MTLDDYAERGFKSCPLGPSPLENRSRGPMTTTYEMAMRAQFAPLPRPPLWERLKRWWYSQ